MIKIYWHSLFPSTENFFETALEELRLKLKESYPQIPDVYFEPVSDAEVRYVSRDETYQRGGLLDEQSLNPLQAKRLVVICQGNEPFVLTAKEANPMASWGAAIQGEYALIWEPNNKYLIWHETLHILYAMDSYDKNRQTTCEEPRCIMQWEPTAENCGGDLYICEGNIKRILNCA